jgi:hypothetical protein
LEKEQGCGNSKQVRVFSNLVRRDKEGHCILKKRTIQQEYITILNIYAPNIGGLKFIKQTLLGIKE